MPRLWRALRRSRAAGARHALTAPPHGAAPMTDVRDPWTGPAERAYDHKARILQSPINKYFRFDRNAPLSRALHGARFPARHWRHPAPFRSSATGEIIVSGSVLKPHNGGNRAYHRPQRNAYPGRTRAPHGRAAAPLLAADGAVQANSKPIRSKPFACWAKISSFIVTWAATTAWSTGIARTGAPTCPTAGSRQAASAAAITAG